MEKFKTYEPGEPSEKLFVRNLEKRVTIEDLKFIFGRYIPVDEDMDKYVNRFEDLNLDLSWSKLDHVFFALFQPLC